MTETNTASDAPEEDATVDETEKLERPEKPTADLSSFEGPGRWLVATPRCARPSSGRRRRWRRSAASCSAVGHSSPASTWM